MNNEEKILSLLGDLARDISGLKADVGGLKTDVGDLKADVGGLKTDVGGLKTDVADIKDRLVRVELTQENVVIPRLQALAEGQQNLLATLAPKSRVETLEDEIELLKVAVRSLSRDLSDLKKAQ